ncbi:MAG: FKBP-type peptidyl-prolyl cis-trans isomerase [Candidatus Kapaibacteriales bacterium]
MNKLYYFLFVIFFAFILSNCRTSKVVKERHENWITTPSGLKYYDLVVGKGEQPKTGKKVLINFIMKTEDGTIIEDTYKSGIPMSFILGNKDAIEGLEEAVATMRVGGKRKLIVPPELGFGTYSFRNIPPNSSLYIEVELVRID